MQALNELQKAQFCEQLSLILNNGIPLGDGFELMASQEEDKDYKEKLMEISKSLSLHSSLSECLKRSDLFDPYMIGMVEVGEKSGYLDKVSDQLAIYYHRNHDTREKIKNALTYPFILICMMLVVIALLIFKILPLFENVLNNIGVQLSGIAIVFMSFGKVLAIAASIVLLILIAILIYCYISTKKKRYSMIDLLDKFIITRKISYNLALAQFAYCLSLFVNSGYNINEALKMCESLCENQKLKPVIEKLAEDAESMPFGEALLKNPVFSGTYNRLLVIGLQSGSLDKAINTVAESYDKEVDNSISSFMNSIEPILVAVLSFIVAVILLAVMLPLTSIMSSL